MVVVRLSSKGYKVFVETDTALPWRNTCQTMASIRGKGYNKPPRRVVVVEKGPR